MSESGALETPEFARGFDPLNRPKWRPKRKASRWDRALDLGRQNPGQWIKVAEAKKGGCKARRAIINNDRQSINNQLNRHFPLERWTLQVVTLAGTWCDRELWIRYNTTLTPEEDALDRKERSEAQAIRMAEGRRRRQEREALARTRAIQEEAAAQVSIRTRRKPGS